MFIRLNLLCRYCSVEIFNLILYLWGLLLHWDLSEEFYPKQKDLISADLKYHTDV